jgi:hypothetical protein
MKKIKYFLTFLSLVLALSSCTEENYTLGEAKASSDLQITTEIVGTDTSHPYGDGSGTVIFTAKGTNVLTYKFVYNGAETMSGVGKMTYNFGTTGTHKYNVTVIAYGAGGVSTSKTIEVQVNVLYIPPADLVTMLTANSSRTWRIKSESVGHFGVGPADAATSIWWSADPMAKDGKGAYDDRFIFDIDGKFIHNTNGTAYGQKNPMVQDLGGEQGQIANSDNEYANYPLANYTENWTLSAPNGQETLTFSKKGYHGFYVGGNHSYAILSRTENEMRLRTVGADGLGWFVILVAVN